MLATSSWSSSTMRHWHTSGQVVLMTLLGGLGTILGPVVGAVAYTGLQDVLMRGSDYWRATLGAVILFLVIVFPQGLAGGVQALALQWRARRSRRSQQPQARLEAGR